MVVCSNCNQREGTLIWSASAMDYVHGNYAMWCERCAVAEQLKVAQERAAAIPELEAQLKVLDSQDTPC